MRHFAALLVAVAFSAPVRSEDVFDHYVNPTLVKTLDTDLVKEIKQLTPAMIAENDQVLPGITGTVLIVKTNETRNCKLLVHNARQKVFGTDKALPMLLIERFATYREDQERTVLASGKNLALFPSFRVNLDLGQVVPEELGGDLRFVVADGKAHVEPIGKAKLYLAVKPLPDATPKKAGKVVVGEKFEIKYFNGSYKLHDDGRRSGTLKLEVEDDGLVRGSYFSDKDGTKYEVAGRVGMPNHTIMFTIKLPRTEQEFRGMLFTGDAKVLAGTSRILDREASFYATRMEE